MLYQDRADIGPVENNNGWYISLGWMALWQNAILVITHLWLLLCNSICQVLNSGRPFKKWKNNLVWKTPFTLLKPSKINVCISMLSCFGQHWLLYKNLNRTIFAWSNDEFCLQFWESAYLVCAGWEYCVFVGGSQPCCSESRVCRALNTKNEIPSFNITLPSNKRCATSDLEVISDIF